MGAVDFEVAAPRLFRLDLTVWALRRRPHNGVDQWDGTLWRRVIASEAGPIVLTASQRGTPTDPRVAVRLERRGASIQPRSVQELRQTVTRVLGLDVDLSGFADLTGNDAELAALAGRFAGMRPPRFASVFEALVNAVACQQLSLEVGIGLVNRLAGFLTAAPADARSPLAFPTAAQLARADVGALRALGFSAAKARTLVTLGRKVTAGEIDLEALADLDDRSGVERLTALPGIGRWSAEYTLVRGLGRLHVLPGDDVGARNGLRRRFGLAPDAGYGAVSTLARRWWPYAGLIYFHLLLDSLAGEADLGLSPARRGGASRPRLGQRRDPPAARTWAAPVARDAAPGIANG